MLVFHSCKYKKIVMSMRIFGGFSRSDSKSRHITSNSRSCSSFRSCGGFGSQNWQVKGLKVNYGDWISWFLLRKQHPTTKAVRIFQSVWFCKSWTLFFGVFLSIFIHFHFQPDPCGDDPVWSSEFFPRRWGLKKSGRRRWPSRNPRVGTTNMVQLPKAVAGCNSVRKLVILL